LNSWCREGLRQAEEYDSCAMRGHAGQQKQAKAGEICICTCSEEADA